MIASAEPLAAAGGRVKLSGLAVCLNAEDAADPAWNLVVPFRTGWAG